MNWIVFLLIATVWCQQDGTCYKYLCQEFKNSSQCSKIYNNNLEPIHQLHQCPSDKYCAIKKDHNDSYCEEKIKFRYLGEICSGNKDCKAGNCIYKRCEIENKTGNCKNDEECSYGYFCNDKTYTCAKVANEYQSCLNAKCDAGLVCNLGFCAKIGGYNNGIEVSTSDACKSFYSDDYPKSIEKKYKCAPGPKLVENKDGELKGEPKIECKYRIEELNVTKTKNLTCGMNEDGKKYCNPGEGDISMKDVLFKYIQYFDFVEKLPKNHTRHISCGVFCLTAELKSMNPKYCKAYIAYENLKRWSNYQNNPKCVQDMLTQQYWDCLKIENEEFDMELLYIFGGVSGGIVVSLFILFTVIQIKKKKEDNEDEYEDEEEENTKDYHAVREEN